MGAEVTGNSHPIAGRFVYSSDTLHPTVVHPTIPRGFEPVTVGNFLVIRPSEEGLPFDPEVIVYETDELPEDDPFHAPQNGFMPIGGHRRKVWRNVNSSEILNYEIELRPRLESKKLDRLAGLVNLLPSQERLMLGNGIDNLIPFCYMAREEGIALTVHKVAYFNIFPDRFGFNPQQSDPEDYEINPHKRWDDECKFRFNLDEEPYFFEVVTGKVPINAERGKERFTAVVIGLMFAGSDFQRIDPLIMGALSGPGLDKDSALRRVVDVYLRFENIGSDKKLKD